MSRYKKKKVLYRFKSCTRHSTLIDLKVKFNTQGYISISTNSSLEFANLHTVYINLELCNFGG